MRLTRAAVQGLEIPNGKAEAIFFDDDIPGFGLRLRAGGSRNWIVQYKLGNKHRRLTFGSVAVLDPMKARERARDLLAQVRLGSDPAGTKMEARARADETLGAIINRFLARQKIRLRPRSYLETERYLQSHWKPLHGLALAKVARATVANRLASIADTNGLTAADRARAALSGFFSWAIREGIAEVNPVLATNRASTGQSRDRVLSDEEIAAIWRALPNDQYGTIVRLLILTGQRREEIGALALDEVDTKKAMIVLSGTRTKNYRPHEVPLSSVAVTLIDNLPRRLTRDLIFGEGEGAFQGWSRAKSALGTRLANLAAKNGLVGAWRLHDIRRTVATRMGDLGVQPHVIEAVLNHVSGHKAGVAGVYNRSLYVREKRSALDLWGNHVLTLIDNPGDGGQISFPPLKLQAECLRRTGSTSAYCGALFHPC